MRRKVVEIRLADLLSFHSFHRPIADGGQHDLEEEFRHRARRRAGHALQGRPPEEVVADDEGEEDIIHKLRDDSRGVTTDGKSQKAPIFQHFSEKHIEKIIQQRRREKGDRAAEDHEPRGTDRAVQRGVDHPFRSLDEALRPQPRDVGRGDEERREEEIDREGADGQNVCCPRAEALGHDVHQEEYEPGEQDAAVKGEPREIYDALIREQVHRDDRHGEKRGDKARHVAEQ